MIKLAAMGINIWIIFASILFVSVRARRYDQGPHTFYDFSSGLATTGPYGQRELILYLTPDQVRSLAADGAVVKSDKDDENDSELSADQQANEDQDEENDDPQEDEEENDDTQEENDDSQEEEENDDSQAEDAEQEEESPEQKKSRNIDFEAILRLLNEERVDEVTSEEQSSNNPRIEAEISEEPRRFSPRFTFRRQQHEQKNIALAAAKKEQIFKTYSSIRYQPYGQHQRFNYQLHQQDYDTKTPEEFDERLIGTPIQGTKKYKLVPYKIEETVDEPGPNVNAQQQNFETEEEVQTAKTNKLLREELLKYAIRVQKLKNSEKTRAQTKANSKDTVVPIQIKQQQSRKQSQIGKAPARSVHNKQTKPQQPKSIAVPVMIPEKSALQKPIKVPVGTSKLVRNKPYISSRKFTTNKKENSEEVEKDNPERITILRQF